MPFYFLRSDTDNENRICRLCSHFRSILCDNLSYIVNSMLSTEEKLTLVRRFILCHFNFCPAVWNFSSVTDTKMIEKIQERALHFVYGRCNFVYGRFNAGNQIWPCYM